MRRTLILVPVVLSSLVLGAHLLRNGLPWLAVAVAALPLLLFACRGWATRVVQLVLVIGAAEWTRTLIELVARRQQLGLPSTRLTLILGTVVVVTAASAALLSRFGARTAAAADPAAAR